MSKEYDADEIIHGEPLSNRERAARHFNKSIEEVTEEDIEKLPKRGTGRKKKAELEGSMKNISISVGGPYPACPKCRKGNLVPILITDEDGDTGIDWECTNCGHRV